MNFDDIKYGMKLMIEIQRVAAAIIPNFNEIYFSEDNTYLLFDHGDLMQKPIKLFMCLVKIDLEKYGSEHVIKKVTEFLLESVNNKYFK